jgi:hypothetical protein
VPARPHATDAEGKGQSAKGIGGEIRQAVSQIFSFPLVPGAVPVVPLGA